MKVNPTIAPDFENIFPPLAPDELAQLERAVLDDPDHERMPPIIVWSNNKNIIVDGHNQYRLRGKHRLTIKFAGKHFETRDEALHYGAAVQLGRRNLTAGQRATFAAKYPKPGGSQSATAAAAGVSRRTIQQATAVQEKGSKPLKQAVEEGTISVADASKVLDQPATEQAAAVRKVKQGQAASVANAVAGKIGGEERNREWGEGDSLEDVQADLKEAARRCLDLSKFMRTILRCEGDEITRPWCQLYSLMTVSHPILHSGRTIKNDMPVDGTAKKPILFHEQKANSIG